MTLTAQPLLILGLTLSLAACGQVATTPKSTSTKTTPIMQKQSHHKYYSRTATEKLQVPNST